MRRIPLVVALLALAAGIAAAPPRLASRTTAALPFVHFESAHVHPAAMTPDGARLLVVNTPDNRLSVFSLAGGDPARVAEIPVGLEPVSVAALDDSTAWVVNQISDDVSIVDLDRAHVVGTIRVGDDPGDVVFANGKAYVSVGTENAVKVYDAATRALLATIQIPGHLPRALAKHPDGSRVYVANLMSGNRTTILSPAKLPVDSVPQDPDMPMDPGLPAAPHVGIIVQQQGSGWFDMYGTPWNSKIKYTMPDPDVVEIGTASDAVTRSFSSVGSTVFTVAVSPADGRLVAPATEGRNLLRFEPRLSGYVVETQVTFITQAGVAALRKLDPHIDYETIPGTQAEADSAIGIPTGAAFSADGQRAYVTSLATDRIAVLNPTGGALSTIKARVPCVAGPTGVLVDDARGRIYVIGRFRNRLQTLSAATLQPVAETSIGMDPTPDAIVNGRRVFYGGFTSTHGDQACASCHVFGDLDGLAWDLGDPFGGYVGPPNPNPLGLVGFHPMKGPLVTQTLKGMTNTEPLHWRGDRANFLAFNGAIVSLLGSAAALPDSQMQAMADFCMPMVLPPNPNQYLDRSFPGAPPGSPSASRGRDFFLSQPVLGTKTCVDCHDETNHGPGTNRQMVSRDEILETQDLKVPQLRNLYRKTGFVDSAGAVTMRGFGYTHDGSSVSPFRFLHRPQFTFDPDPQVADDQRRDMEAYLMTFDTGMAPAVGCQVTFDGSNNADATLLGRVDTLKGQAAVDYCDLIAKGRIGDDPRSWLYLGGDQWQGDRVSEPPIATAQLLALAAGPASAVTITGVPDGTGERIGLDRDGDGWYDSDEQRGGFDPGDPGSHPSSAGIAPERGAGFALRAVAPNPFRDAVEVSFTLARGARVDAAVYDLLGREVRSVARGQFLAAGPASLRWNGDDASGRRAAAGVYFVRVSIPEAGIRWTRPVVRIR